MISKRCHIDYPINLAKVSFGDKRQNSKLVWTKKW
jgi:hypothetical protein